MRCPGDGRLPRTVSSVVSDTWGPEMQSPLAIRGRCSRDVPCMGYKYGLALVGPWWSNAWGQGASLASLAELWWSWVCVLAGGDGGKAIDF